MFVAVCSVMHRRKRRLKACLMVWQLKGHDNHFRKLHQKPDFILVYTNTIYILNHIIFECFDIAFKETIEEKERNKILFMSVQ